MKPTQFDLVLSKNTIARELKRLYKQSGEKCPEFIIYSFNDIEAKIGTMNQPTCDEILTSSMDI